MDIAKICLLYFARKTIARLLLSPLVIAALPLVISQNLHASSQADDIVFSHLTVDEGLASNIVNDIVTDSNGFLWMATEHGLSRFDGQNFKNFVHVKDDSDSISENVIRRLRFFSDKKLMLIFSSGDFGIFDLETEKFKSFHLSHLDNQKKRRIATTDALVIDSEKIWLTTFGQGLIELNLKTGDLKSIVSAPKTDTENELKYRTIFRDDRERIWIGAQTHVKFYNPENGEFTKLDIPALSNFGDGDGPTYTDLRVNHIMQARNGDIWLATSHGVISLDANNQLKQHFRKIPDRDDGLVSNFARHMLESPDGKIWVASFERGISQIDPETGKILHIQYQKNRTSSLGDNSVHRLLFNEQGMLFVATRGAGLSIWNPTSALFASIDSSAFTHTKGQRNNWVWATYESKDNEFWIGTDSGLARFNRTTGETQIYSHDPDNPDSLTGNNIYKIIATPQGVLWIATSSGLSRFDPVKNQFQQFVHKPDDIHSVPNNNIYTLLYQNPGILWVGTERGLCKMSLDDFNCQNFHHDKVDANSLSDNIASEIIEDSRGAIWIGTNNGINRYNPAHQNFERFLFEEGRENSNYVHLVSFMLETEPEVFWVGFNADGIKKIDFTHSANKPIINAYNVQNEKLSFESAVSALQDEENNLWMGTYVGLARLNTQTGDLRIFDVKDGLLSNEFNQGAVLKRANGEMMFGGVKGLVTFYPDKVNREFKSTQLNPVSLLNIRVFESGKKNKQLIPKSQRVQLSHTQNLFEIHYAAIDFARPRLHNYRYRLLGFDNNWIDNSHNRSATFANLKPGVYTFEVKAKTENATSYSKPSRLIIEVLPPPWRTTSAYLIYSCITLLVSTLVYYRLRRNRLREAIRQAELRESEKRLHLAHWGSGEALWDWDTKSTKLIITHFIEADSDAKKTRTFTSKEVDNRVHPEDAKKLYRMRDDLQAGNATMVAVEYRAKNKAGEWEWIRTRGRVVETNDQGEAVRFAGTFKVITQEKASQSQLLMFGQAYQNASEGILIVNTQRRVIAVNPAFEMITGFEPHEAIGQSTLNQKFLDYSMEFLEGIWQEAEENKRFEGELLASHKNGHKITVWLRINRVSKDDSTTGYAVVINDVSELKASHEKLQVAKDAAEQANLAKSTFLANMSHEIRTPLNAVLGYAQILLQENRLPRQDNQLVKNIEKSGNHLLNLINEILELSKIEAGAMSLQTHAFNLTELLDELASMFAMRCQQKNLSWHLHSDIQDSTQVAGDRNKIAQILINLLGNAVKFTQQGTISLHVNKVASNKYLFEIRDTGPGITEQALEIIFDPFQQANDGMNAGGTGLGLAIVNRLLELMNTILGVSTTQGQGSCFYFNLELEPAVIQQEESPQNELTVFSPDKKLAALVVDDVEHNRDILARSLALVGAETCLVESGEAAIETALDRPFDIIFMDIRMPGMSGSQSMQRIKQQLTGNAPLCIAVTASALDRPAQYYLDQGFDGFIAKPFQLNALYELLEEHLGYRIENQQVEPAQSAETVVASSLPRRLLEKLAGETRLFLVDDIEQTLNEVTAIGEPEAALAENLRTFVNNYDMEGLRQQLEQVVTND